MTQSCESFPFDTELLEIATIAFDMIQSENFPILEEYCDLLGIGVEGALDLAAARASWMQGRPMTVSTMRIGGKTVVQSVPIN